MSLSQLATPLTKDQALALADAVMEREDLALSATAFKDQKTGEWFFEATCDTPPDLEVFAELARQTLGGDINFSREEIDPKINWVAKSLEGLAPVVAGGFCIHGSHDAGKAPVGTIPIMIDAAEAFGTGHHETTTGCLEAIEHVLKSKKPRFLLDVGTGTGVLAIALAKRLRMPVVATDIDPVAVRAANENAQKNNVGALLLGATASGLKHRLVSNNAPYDLIVANILAAPLVELAPSIGRAAEPGATIILAGLLNTQSTAVLAAYRLQNMMFEKRLVLGEWTTLILKKAGRI